MEDKKVKTKKQPETQPQTTGSKRTCLTLFGGFALGLVIVFLLFLAGVAVAITSTGLVEVPVLSSLFMPPEITEDFSYQEVPLDGIEEKISFPKGTVDRVDLTLTSDDVNTFINSELVGAGTAAKSIAVRLEEGVIKVKGEVTIPDMAAAQDTTFYAVVKINKEKDGPLELEIQEARLGSLSLPSFVTSGLINSFLSSSGVSLEEIPIEEITITEGSVHLGGIDPSAFGGE
ncbi:hypothetical protein GTO10_01740 [Candidatus Saccharibacteria bacterium]|nr:hypothetical protein [Candidatus Saccharibacteria bacterium]